MFRVSRYATKCHFFALVLAVCLGTFAFVPSAPAQDQDKNKDTQPAQPAQNSTDSARPAAPAQTAPDTVDPLKRPIDIKKKKQQQKDFSKEIKGPYKKWLDEDVAWIITDEERAAFKQLSNDEERDNFIEAFWQRRDPTPDTEENEFKEEHYRRIAYANEHFAAGIPGWKTDRGRIYIMYGPAGRDRISSRWRNLRAPHGRGRRRDFDLPVRRLALSLSGRYRPGSHYRIRGSRACAANTT